MASGIYRTNPDSVDQQTVLAQIYVETYGQVLGALITKRSWGWLTNTANHEQLTVIAEQIAQEAVFGHVLQEIEVRT